ncbi:hypothetical protein J2Z80_000284 [Thermoanaerobacterium butyriciformans]|uniref:DUF4825 domain-containing protein n=1 Tax=Thermoanaerobacterium butyriciformans TaxID=1702242 RepID=A0ABS4NAU6_9THEO|nr:hypothetical protein [Thermoanaerobacterium butyriciformans]
MKRIKIVSYIIIFFVFIFITYTIYYKPTTVNEILTSNNLSREQFNYLYIYDNNSVMTIKDKNKINNLLSYMKQLTIIESLKNDIPKSTNKYMISFENSKTNNSLRITILNKNFIEIGLKIPNKIIYKKYRILNKPIDFTDINNLLK